MEGVETLPSGGACEGRVAIVTGASRGLGAAIAAALATEGGRVALVARTLEATDGRAGSLRETEEAIRAAGGEVLAVPADLSAVADRHRVVEEVSGRLGPADILVNNAAVSWLAPVADFADKRFGLMFEIKVRAPFELAQLVLPAMRARRQGWILNLTSRAAVHPEGPPYGGLYRKGGFTVYGMCKAAVDRFTTGLAAEVYGDGIAVNALAPWDPVATPGTTSHELTGAALESPDLIARSAVLLCSTPPSELTGRVLFTQPFLAEWDGRPGVWGAR